MCLSDGTVTRNESRWLRSEVRSPTSTKRELGGAVMHSPF